MPLCMVELPDARSQRIMRLTSEQARCQSKFFKASMAKRRLLRYAFAFFHRENKPLVRASAPGAQRAWPQSAGHRTAGNQCAPDCCKRAHPTVMGGGAGRL